MISFKDAAAAVGYNADQELPMKLVKFRAYKDGKCEVFESHAEANQASELVEPFVVNQGEIDEARRERGLRLENAIAYWKAALRLEYSYIDDRVFHLCYEKAYEDGHSAGYDEIAAYMGDYVEFAEAVRGK